MNAKEKHALWRGNWVQDDGFTMPAYKREASSGQIQVIIRLANKSGWRLVVNGEDKCQDKSLFQVLRMANVASQES